MKFKDILKSLRTEKGLSQTDLAKITGLTRSAIGMYEVGKREPNFETLEILADFFNVDMNTLLGKNSITNKLAPNVHGLYSINTRKIPLLGKIACGKPIMTEECFEGYVQAGTNIRVDFCLVAKGDSMINARIYDGDIVFIRQQPEVENGEIAAILIDGGVTLKRVYYYDTSIELRAENPKYRPMIFKKDEYHQFKILGKAIAFQADIV